MRTSLFSKFGLTCLILMIATLGGADWIAESTLRGVRLSEFHLRMWEMALPILILGIVIWIFFASRFSRRVARLREISRRLGAEDSHPLGEGLGKNDLGELAQILNETSLRIAATIRSLTEERDRATAILRSMGEGVAVIDAEERIIFCNNAFALLWAGGAPNNEGKPVVEVIRQPDTLELIRSALSGKGGLKGEISVGSTRPRSFSVTVTPVPMLRGGKGGTGTQVGGPGFGAVVVLHEITELKRLDQVRKDFVANVSHELRTPLTAIQGFAETLLQGALEDQQNNRRFVEIIRSHAARLGRLTDDLLKLSRIEAGKLELEFRPISVSELIDAEVELGLAAARHKSLSLAVDSPATLPRILGDANLLREVLRNLLDNALQYTPAGGKISVCAHSEDKFVVVTVADTGIGIPHADQSRIFERFYRVDAARSREVGGTGLGLAITKHIVEAHQGRIWVDSEVGQGSKFHFSVPIIP